MSLPVIFPVTSHTQHVGRGSTFVAIKGYKEDGAKYILKAIKLGATRIVQEWHEGCASPLMHLSELQNMELFSQKQIFQNGVFYVFVEDTRRALAILSARAAGSPAQNLKIIGITGTKGKTTISYLLCHLLREFGHKVALLSTVENRIGDETFPTERTTMGSDYIQQFLKKCVDNEVSYVVMEVSSHALSLDRVFGIEFDGVGFTNLASEHMDFYASMEDYFAAKAKLFDQLKKGGIGIVGDDEWSLRVLREFSGKKKVLSCGHGDAKHLVVPGTLLGTFNAQNAYLAMRLLKALGYKKERLLNALQSFPGVPGRMERFPLKNGAVAYVDYAHNTSSLEAVLSTLRPMTDHLIVVFGCGGERDKLKRPQMGHVAAMYGDMVVITDDNPRGEDPRVIVNEILKGISQADLTKVQIFHDRKKAIKHAFSLVRPGSIIALCGKGHETTQVVCDEMSSHSDRQQISQGC